jgi:hypothetical protein
MERRRLDRALGRPDQLLFKEGEIHGGGRKEKRAVI